MAREIASSSRTPRPRRSPRALWSFSLSASNIAARRVAGLDAGAPAVRLATWSPQPQRGRRSASSSATWPIRPRSASASIPSRCASCWGAWYEEMRIAVEQHGGMVEKFIGDAVMAVFGLPRAHEDDALRAVRAALDMQRAVERLNASLEAREVPELRIRIGINTGEVVTGDDAATLATGDAVNTAKRLEQAAGGGEILIGAVTERLVRHASRLDAARRRRGEGQERSRRGVARARGDRRRRVVRPPLGHAARREDARARRSFGTS